MKNLMKWFVGFFAEFFAKNQMLKWGGGGQFIEKD
jgi:hypothetical protein